MNPGGSPVPGVATLRRELGRWDLTAVGVNQVIGSAIFLLPSVIAAEVGGWSLAAFLLGGLASLFVALCFAEVGSRFETTGGPYLYARSAFGRFVGFEVGWMQWVTRVTSHASVANGIAVALGFYWPFATRGVGRAAVIGAITLAIGIVMVRGIRESAWLVNLLTFGKLLPLTLFILVGLWFVDIEPFRDLPPISWSQASTAALLLIFVYGGYDIVPIPAGEASDPRRHVPFALVMTIVVVTVVMTAAQFVAQGNLPSIATSSTPLADAAFLTMGAAGALMIGVGSVISMTGNNAGAALTGSRMLFALAEQGDIPAVLARIHPRYRTPAVAIVTSLSIVLVLALSGSFVALAAMSGVARLVTYAGACAATLALRRRRPAGVGEAAFTIPLGPLVPVLALLVSAGILAGASWPQLTAGGLGLLSGAVIFGVTEAVRRSGRPARV